VEFTVGDNYMGSCDQTLIRTCLVLDGYNVVATFILERMVKAIENIMDKNNERTHYVTNLNSKFTHQIWGALSKFLAEDLSGAGHVRHILTAE
jgi:hypothetical protein